MTKNTTLVSIIMNCYNGAKYLKEAIDSIYAQSYYDWEIIFWDNGSTDNSASIAKEYDERLRYFFAEKTTPLGEARNLALREANGYYIAFLDCDDMYLPDKIKTQLATMQASSAVLSYGSWIKINEKGEELKKYKAQQISGDMFESLLSHYIVNFHTLMIDNNYLKRNNINFDECLKFSPDFNLVLRIVYSGAPVIVINELLGKYRAHSNSMSNNRKIDKYNDFDYTINFFEKLGVQKKYKNFKYISSKARLKILLLDALDEKNYKYFLKIVIQYLFIITRVFLNKSTINSDL